MLAMQETIKEMMISMQTHLLPLPGIGWTTRTLYHRTMSTKSPYLKYIPGQGVQYKHVGWSGNVRNHPKENKKAFTEQGIMFFRNTHVAHKILRKPYFTGCVVLQTIICRFERDNFKNLLSRKFATLPGFLYIHSCQSVAIDCKSKKSQISQ